MQWIVSLTPEVGHDPMVAVGAPPPEATLVEVRLDLFPDLDLESLVAACPVPILATLRSTAEGGRGPTGSDERKRRLAVARDAGAALIDIEWLRDREMIRALGLAPEQVILSWHDPFGTPTRFEDVVVEMITEGNAAWVKAVPTAHSISDLEQVLAVYASHRIPQATDRRESWPLPWGPLACRADTSLHCSAHRWASPRGPLLLLRRRARFILPEWRRQ